MRCASVRTCIQLGLDISIWSFAQKAIHLAKHPLIERPLSGDLQFRPPKSDLLIELFADRLPSYRVSTVLATRLYVMHPYLQS